MSEDLTFHVRSGPSGGPPTGSDSASRTADRLAQQLALAIMEARLPEGTMLPPEHELMAHLGCSRVALRGALRLLVSWGLISMRMGREGGPMVRRPRALDLRDGLAVLMHNERATFADVLLARRAIDPIIAAEAARNVTDHQIVRLRDVVARLETLVQSPEDFQQGINDLSELLAEAASLAILGVLLRALAAVSDLSLRGRVPLDEERCWQAIATHRLVVEAVAARDSEGAEQAMRACRVDSERYWRRTAPDLTGAPLRPLAATGVAGLDLSGLRPRGERNGA